MKGIINILKPPGMTSSDVVTYIRRRLNIKKVGHTGTLDPDAAGVLPICIGKATKISDYILQDKKIYICEVKLGIETDTLDISGEVSNRTSLIPSKDRIIETINSFIGENNQIPPMHSAIKIKGKKLYDLARQGIMLDLPPRRIYIYNIRLIGFTTSDQFLIEVECSKGTYIRALCRDIGKALDCGATMSFLLRNATGNFLIENSYTLDELSRSVETGDIDKLLLPVDKVLASYMPYIRLNKKSYSKIINGNWVSVDNVIEKEDHSSEGLYRIYCEHQFIGIGNYDTYSKPKYIKIKTMLM